MPLFLHCDSHSFAALLYLGQGLAGRCQELVRWGCWRARSLGQPYIIVYSGSTAAAAAGDACVDTATYTGYHC